MRGMPCTLIGSTSFQRHLAVTGGSYFHSCPSMSTLLHPAGCLGILGDCPPGNLVLELQPPPHPSLPHHFALVTTICVHWAPFTGLPFRHLSFGIWHLSCLSSINTGARIARCPRSFPPIWTSAQLCPLDVVKSGRLPCFVDYCPRMDHATVMHPQLDTPRGMHHVPHPSGFQVQKFPVYASRGQGDSEAHSHRIPFHTNWARGVIKNECIPPQPPPGGGQTTMGCMEANTHHQLERVGGRQHGTTASSRQKGGKTIYVGNGFPPTPTEPLPPPGNMCKRSQPKREALCRMLRKNAP